MKSIIFIATLSVMLTACSGGGGGAGMAGGGGDNTNSTSAAMPAVAAQKLDAYIGTWAADCVNHEIEYAIITRTADDAVKVSSKVDYYAGADCTGSIVGTQTDTGDVTAKYAGTANATVALPPSTTATAVKVDQVTMTVPTYSVTVSGPGVTRVTKDGGPQWCMDFGNDDTTCIHDDGARQGATSSGALYVQDNQMYVLGTTTSGFSVDQRLTRK